MSWWCAASDAAWNWSWQAYPGVWLFVGALAAGYTFVLRRFGPIHAPLPELAVRPRHPVVFGMGLLALWAATDWPLGALGAGYLLSAHTLQYLAYTLVVPPLLLLGTPEWVFLGVAERPTARRFLRVVARPLPALLIVDGVLLVSHWPPLVNGLRPLQWGSFMMDVAWLAAGLAMWWPVVAPPALGRLGEPGKMGYLFLTTIIPTIPAAFFTFADFPVYSLYELAPRVHGIAAGTDQQAAGLMMKALGDPIVWLAIAVVFFRWSRREAATDRVDREQHRRRAHAS